MTALINTARVVALALWALAADPHARVSDRGAPYDFVTAMPGKCASFTYWIQIERLALHDQAAPCTDADKAALR